MNSAACLLLITSTAQPSLSPRQGWRMNSGILDIGPYQSQSSTALTAVTTRGLVFSGQHPLQVGLKCPVFSQVGFL